MEINVLINFDRQNTRQITLTQYLDKLLSEGRHYFTSEEIQTSLGMNKNTVSASLSRLGKKKRVKMVKRGFGIILNVGGVEPHPSFYIDAMMKHLGVQYYVGLLAAAAHWGAGHQSSMTYHVVANKSVFKISFEKLRMEFVTKRETFTDHGVKKVAVVGGYYKISSPELTALDVVRFAKKSGHLNNVATILKDLSQKWDGRAMFSLCHDPLIPSVTLQRLGFILDRILGLKKEAKYVSRALNERTFVPAWLSQAEIKRKNLKKSNYEYNEEWKLYINTKVEPD
jgi:predicted transcriptional regulator of viral defense system